ncbi:MAG: penicillin-binding protein 2, penicillin-binding protein 2 [Candidatus Doudnabacteria bacterium]|nr:penicillin-binding protein 2, penicillin-binding protein 2 [Candidatus Doudnabacteria bacterium]
MKDPFSVYNSNFNKKSGDHKLDWEEGALFQAEEPDDYYEGHATESKSLIYVIALFLIFGVLSIRLGYLQVVQGKQYLTLAENNRLRVQDILAPRGIIFDSQNQPLVDNVPSFELVATPADVSVNNLQQTLQSLSELVPFDVNDISNKIIQEGPHSFRSVSIAANMPKDTALLFESKAEQFPGFSIENNPIRQYKEPEVFSHLLGYTGKITDKELAANPSYALNDYIGKSGLELTYENYLKGVEGQKQVEVDAHGNLKNIHGQIDPQPGQSLVLNIDGDLQRELYKEIVAKNGNKKAAAVAINPQTGQVLALISLPGFDNNLFSGGISQKDYQALVNDPQKPLFDRAIAGTYPPGSTIKPTIAAAALQEGVVNDQTKIFDNGDLVLGGYHFHGWKAGGLGSMDVRSAIAMSSDIYFYTVGGGQAALNIAGLGPERLDKYDYLFGMGQKLGIDLPGEQPGLVPGPEWKKQYFKDPTLQIWYPGDTYHISIGQGDLLATPLQVAMWTATVANGGTLYQPYILDKVLDNNGNVVFQNQPKAIRAGFIDPKNIEIVREGMRQTVTSGTARSLDSLPITSAGKTGTAQFDAADPKATHAWFTAFAPYENPKIVIVVLIEAGGEGSSAATPVVKETLKWWAENRNK